MATKTTKTAAAGAESIETAMKNGADAVKDGFDKAAKGYDQFVAFAKDTAEAWTSAANVAGKGIETINTEWFAYSRSAVEEGISATKAMLESKSPKEFLDIQSDFARKALDAYVTEVSKVSDIAVSTTKSSMAPLQASVSAFVELTQKSAV